MANAGDEYAAPPDADDDAAACVIASLKAVPASANKMVSANVRLARVIARVIALDEAVMAVCVIRCFP